MSRKLALKRLTHSDLTVFKSYYAIAKTINPKGTNQKAINLNINIFVKKFYPALNPKIAYPVSVSIYGPGITAQHLLTKNIRKEDKNWRLNGKFILDPIRVDVDRYKSLREGDLVLFEFLDGASGEPEQVSMVLLSRHVAADNSPYDALSTYLGSKSMVALTPELLADQLDGVNLDGHPIQSLLLDDSALELLADGITEDESVAEGPITGFVSPSPATSAKPGAAATRTRTYTPPDLTRAPKALRRRVSVAALNKAKTVQANTGNKGEELINEYFIKNPGLGIFEWVSKTDAYSPYDFRRNDITEGEYVDVKTTSDGFYAPFHISMGELRQAAHASAPYYIYRVYDIRGQPKLRISGDISELAKNIIEKSQEFQGGVVPDAFTLYPSELEAEIGFGKEVAV